MSAPKQLCVYTHSANGQVFYVGQGTRSRPRCQNNRSRAWRAHVEAVGHFDVEIVHWTDDRNEAVRIESELIAAHPAACNTEKYDRKAFSKSVAMKRRVFPPASIADRHRSLDRCPATRCTCHAKNGSVRPCRRRKGVG
jgi:hypothetical protein